MPTADLQGFGRFKCMECGKSCLPRGFHDFVECVRYRVTDAPRSDDDTATLRQMEKDVESLLRVIDLLASAPREYSNADR